MEADHYLNTTEFVSFEPSRPGPELPMNIADHCMVKINDLVIISGSDYLAEAKTLIVDVSADFSITFGPNMKVSRTLHSCGTFNYKNNSVMIVTGGIASEPYSTEIWNPYSNEGWTKGIVSN